MVGRRIRAEINCVLCPAGANFPDRGSAFTSSRRMRMRPIVTLIDPTFFSGANVVSDSAVGISMLTDSRSAKRPASAISRSSASGIVFRWMYPRKSCTSRSVRATRVSSSIV
jgi:hypothetical protein